MSCMKSFRSEFCLLQEASLVLGNIHFLQYASNEIVIFQKLECNQSFSQPCFYISSADVLAYLVIGLFCCRCCFLTYFRLIFPRKNRKAKVLCFQKI